MLPVLDVLQTIYNQLTVQRPTKQNHIPPGKNSGYNSFFDNVSYCRECNTYAYEFDHHWLDPCPNCKKTGMVQISSHRWTLRNGQMQWVCREEG